MTFDEAVRILAAFERHGVVSVLIGSMAMAAHGIVRATRDIDFFVDPAEPNVARVKAALQDLFHDPEVDQIGAADLAGAYPVIQYVPEGADYWIDFVTRLGDAFQFADVEWERIIVAGVPVCVATPRMLYRMKRDTVRPQDRADAQMLKERFSLEDD
jgi:hypothetical protein